MMAQYNAELLKVRPKPTRQARQPPRQRKVFPCAIPFQAPFTAYVSNIPYEVDEDRIRQHFWHCSVIDIRLVRMHNTNQSKGYGYIEFGDRQSLVIALKYHGTNLMGRTITVDIATPKPDPDKPHGQNLTSSNIEKLCAEFKHTQLGDPAARFDSEEEDTASVVSRATSTYTVLSTLHGRERKRERGVTTRDLQEAIKHGTKVQSHSGRWKYTHKGVVYVTDRNSRVVITTWRTHPNTSSHEF